MGGHDMRLWIQAALAAAVTAWLLMGGLDYLETHFYAMKWVQMNMTSMHEGFMKTLGGGK
jgi:hypothetical protein